MWQTMLKKDASFTTYLHDFSNLLKAQMSLTEGLQSENLKQPDFQNVREDLRAIIDAVENTDFGDMMLSGESVAEQLDDLMDNLEANISREEALQPLESSVRKLIREYQDWKTTQVTSLADTKGGDSLKIPYYNKTSGKWDEKTVQLTLLVDAKEVLEALVALKGAFENPIVNVNNELEYDSRLYDIVDKLGKGAKFNNYIKPVYNMSPRQGPLSVLFRQNIGNQKLADLGDKSTELARRIANYQAKLEMVELKIMRLLKSNVANTDQDLFERMVAMVKRQDVEEAFKVTTQAAFDRLFGGEVSEATSDRAVSNLMQEVEDLDGVELTLSHEELMERFGL